MIILIASDTLAPIGNEYFSLSRNNAADILQTNELIHIDGTGLTRELLESTISELDQQSFGCVIFSHGSEIGLISSQQDASFLDHRNCYYFGSSCVAAFCCFSADSLSESLRLHNANSFVGYSDRVHMPVTKSDIEAYLVAELNPLPVFFQNQVSAGVLLNLFYDSFEAVIQECRRLNRNVLASRLAGDRNRLNIWVRS